MLVNDFLQSSAERFPDKVALICDGQRLTYAQIEEQANRVANGLLQSVGHLCRHEGLDHQWGIRVRVAESLLLPLVVETLHNLWRTGPRRKDTGAV